MAFCSNCGKELKESYKFCPKCGKEIDNISEVKKVLHACPICGYITEEAVCEICSNKNRNHNVICVLEDYKSVFAFEKAGNYNGVYHVLNGLISPIDDVNPEDINIRSLINKRISSEVKEVILSLNPSVEGEMTSLYIKKLLEDKDIKVSRLSYGLPVNADIEYLDPLTIIRAIDDRKFLS